MERKETLSILRPNIPNSDFVVVTSCDEEGSTRVNGNTPYRTFMLLESINQNAHAIIPQLHTTIVERCGEERLCRMKSKPLHAIAFGFELREHNRHARRTQANSE